MSESPQDTKLSEESAEASADDTDAPKEPAKPRKKPIEKESREPRRRRGRDLVGVLACVAVVCFARASLADHYVVPSGSMEPTVETGDRVVVAKYAYGLRIPLSHTWLSRWGAPHRGDVVVLESPEGGTILLKRVVALPGDTVTVRNGALSINNVHIERTGDVEDLDGKRHDVSLALGGGPDYGPTTLPTGRFLVMGDNRGNSRDGRMFGLVDGDTILGRAERIYYRGSENTGSLSSWLNAFSWRVL